MTEHLNRGEQRPFTIYLTLEENAVLTEDHDAVVMVKHDRSQANDEAIIEKRLRSDPPQLVLEQANGPDPESGEGNVAIVTGVFVAEDTRDLFTGIRSRADVLEYIIEAGVVFPGGYYDPQYIDSFRIENTVYHLPSQ